MGKDALEKQGEAECERAENRALGNVCLKRKHERIGQRWERMGEPDVYLETRRCM